MNQENIVHTAPPEGMPVSEWELRKDLAAAYRLVAMYGWDDLIATHISARLPDEEGAFLINPLGTLFDEMTASALVKVDESGKVLTQAPFGINQAAFVIHSAIHMGRADAHAIIHLHTKDGVAVSCLEEGLLPMFQTSLLVDADICYHDYEGVAFEIGERERLQADLGNKNLMILRNHGTLTVGESLSEAFLRMYTLETACSIQARALAMGRPIYPVDTGAIDRSRQIGGMVMKAGAHIAWQGLLKKLAKQNPGWDQ